MAIINLSNGEVDTLDVLAFEEEYYQTVYNTRHNLFDGFLSGFTPVSA